MSDLQNLFILSMAQAQAAYLLVNSSLSLRLQSKLKLPEVVKELLSCPVCIGFWIAAILALGHPVNTLAIGFIGSSLYELKQKFLPCKQCTNQTKVSEWKVS